MALRLYLIIKDGTQNVYNTGHYVAVTNAMGLIQKADDGNYYERTVEVIDGVPTPVMSVSQGTSV